MSGDGAIRVAVSDLVFDKAYQIRLKLDEAAIGRYADAMRAGQEFPPIKIAMVDGAPVIVDGWHRTKAARLAALEILPAEIVQADEKELAWIAAEANRAHGVPLKRSEARNIFRAYVRAGQHKKTKHAVKSAREIAAELQGMRSHTTILQWMRRDFPSVYAKMSQDGAAFENNGGARDVTPEDRRLALITRAAVAIIANARGVKNPGRRGVIIAELEEVLESLKEARPWEPVKAPDDIIDDF